MHCLKNQFLVIFTYNGHIHSVRVGVGEVAEQEQSVVLGQATRLVEIPQLKADVLHRCSLHPGKTPWNENPQWRRVGTNFIPWGNWKAGQQNHKVLVDREHQSKWKCNFFPPQKIADIFPICCTSLLLYWKTVNCNVVSWMLFFNCKVVNFVFYN